MRRVLVCGGRDYADFDKLAVTLCLHHASETFSVVIHGGAPGADRLAVQWAASEEVPTEEYAADWKKLGRRAGPERNARMLTEGKPDLVIAFCGGKGTADMVRRARAAGVEVLEVTDA